MTTDEKLEQLVRRAGKRTPLPDEVKQRLQTSFRRELQLNMRKRNRAKVLVLSGIAASILIAISFLILNDSPRPTSVIAKIERSEGETFWQYEDESGPLSYGNIIQPHDFIHTMEGSLSIRLENSSVNLRLGRMTEIEFIGKSSVRLVSGDIYVDAQPDGNHHSFSIRVNEIEVKHLGTQYLVSSNEDGISIAVREGEVIIKSRKQEFHSKGTTGKGELVSVSRTNKLTRSPINTHGSRWAWVNQMAPTIETNNMPIDKFLSWIARETGLKLVYNSPEILEAFHTELIKGSIPTEDALRALDIVMNTTKYSVIIYEGTIKIHN